MQDVYAWPFEFFTSLKPLYHLTTFIRFLLRYIDTMTTSSRVAIVTGGNSGMGVGIARKLVQNGWKVAIADIQENKKLAEELGNAATYYNCNVADYDRFVLI